VDRGGGEIYGLAGRAVGAWPTNDGLVMTYVVWPAAEFHDFRSDVERNFLRTLDRAGDLSERVRSGARAERFRATPTCRISCASSTARAGRWWVTRGW
jgi:hypothetical protein